MSTPGLLAAVQAAHDDLKTTQGAILVTGGGSSLESDEITQLIIDLNLTTVALAKTAQRKLVHILHKGLAQDGIYVAEMTIVGVIKGTGFDADGKGTITAEEIAEEFWGLLSKRDPAVWYVIKK